MEKKRGLSRAFDREWVFKILFAASFNEDTILKNYDLIKDKHDMKLSEFGKNYLKQIETVFRTETLIHPVELNLTKIDFSQVSRMGQILLQMGVYEMLYQAEIPPEVTINEVLKLAGLYVEDREKRLINSVIDNVYKYFKKNDLLYSCFIEPLR